VLPFEPKETFLQNVFFLVLTTPSVLELVIKFLNTDDVVINPKEER